MRRKAKVVLTDYVWESLDVEKKILAGLAELVPLQTKKPEEFLPQAADCDALLNTYAGPITAEVMAKMPKCRIIARYGIGVDTIDLDAATQAGIIVTNNPTYCIEEVAEHTMALLLACARKVAFYDRLVRAGTLGGAAGQAALPPRGQHARAGRLRQHRAAGGGARGRVRHAGPLRRSVRARKDSSTSRARRSSCPSCSRESDFVSVHPPLTPADAQDDQRRRAFADEADRVPRSTARAARSWTPTRWCARSTRRRSPAARSTRPIPSRCPIRIPLRGRENVIINPHVAWYSEKAWSAAGRRAQRGAPGAVRRMAGQRRQPRREGQEPRRTLIGTDDAALRGTYARQSLTRRWLISIQCP